MVELTLVMGVLLFAFLALSRSLGESMQLTDVNEETAQALDAAREMVEILDGVENFSTVFALYNDEPDDDPGGPGTAPGSGFAVPGLRPAPDDLDQLVGKILFPTQPGVDGRIKLSELVENPALGMPRDLNGDGEADSILEGPVEEGEPLYMLLPVTLRLRWVGASGERTLEIHTLLADR